MLKKLEFIKKIRRKISLKKFVEKIRQKIHKIRKKQKETERNNKEPKEPKKATTTTTTTRIWVFRSSSRSHAMHAIGELKNYVSKLLIGPKQFFFSQLKIITNFYPKITFQNTIRKGHELV